jgi:hypothetical protein
MNLYSTKRALWAAGAVLAASIVGVAAFSLFWPVGVDAWQAAPTPEAAEGAGSTLQQVPPLPRYAAIWQRDLRRPLYDEAPPAVAPRPRPALRARLIGTAVEPGFACAFFATGKGKTVTRGVGETVEGAEIKSISDGSVTLLFAGEQLTLNVEKKEGRR